jgi:hypothetical protein
MAYNHNWNSCVYTDISIKSSNTNKMGYLAQLSLYRDKKNCLAHYFPCAIYSIIIWKNFSKSVRSVLINFGKIHSDDHCSKEWKNLLNLKLSIIVVQQSRFSVLDVWSAWHLSSLMNLRVSRVFVSFLRLFSSRRTNTIVFACCIFAWLNKIFKYEYACAREAGTCLYSKTTFCTAMTLEHDNILLFASQTLV